MFLPMTTRPILCRSVLACLAALALAACGGKKSEGERSLEDLLSGTDGLPAGFPAGLPGGPEGSDPAEMWKQMGQIELTDEMMGNYVKLIEKLGALEGKAPPVALLRAYSLEWRHWVAITGAMARASMVGTREPARKGLEEAIARARKQRDEAPPERRAALEAQIEALEQSRVRVDTHLPEATELDRRNKAVLDRWMDRIEAAGAKK